jgi:hypothetical protein
MRFVQKLLSLALISIVFLTCSEDENPGKFEYAIRNTSQIDLGFVVYKKVGAKATVVRNVEVIKSGEELVVVKSQVELEPQLIIDSIEVGTSQFDEKYKTLNLTQIEKTGVRYVWLLTMPTAQSAEITKNYTSVNICIDETSLLGFYPKIDYPRQTYFFKTSDYFENLNKTQTSSPDEHSRFELLRQFGTTLIGYDRNIYSDKNLFIISANSGISWNTLTDFGFNSDNDFFMGADFINETTGWIFNYNIIFNGQMADTYTTDVYKYESGNVQKISSISGYCMQQSLFIDANIGYGLANTSNNVLPADSWNTYFVKTADGGVSWTNPILVSNNAPPNKLFKLSNGKLILFLDPAFLMDKYYFVSTDDGETWQIQFASVSKTIRDIHFLPDGTGFIKTGSTGGWSFQNRGDVYKTTDGGSSWIRVTENINGSKIYFVNANRGYLQDLIYGKGQILYVTDDSGKNWREVLFPYSYIVE